MQLCIIKTTVEEFPASLRHRSRLEYVNIKGSRNLKTLTHIPTSVTELYLECSGIAQITDCIKGIHILTNLFLQGCRQLASLPELPVSLELLSVEDCESLESVSDSFKHSKSKAIFHQLLQTGSRSTTSDYPTIVC